jgi:hypothetical protein
VWEKKAMFDTTHAVSNKINVVENCVTFSVYDVVQVDGLPLEGSTCND